MLKRVVPSIALAAVVVLGFYVAAPVTGARSAPALTVHEWGTFTTVAGQDGKAMDWLPLGGPVDLPCFVEKFGGPRAGAVKVALSVVSPEDLPALDYAAARSALAGKVRMETPVLYFYAPDVVTARVNVWFPRGILTEWFPKGTVTQPKVDAMSLRNPNYMSQIEWPNVRVEPAAPPEFPMGTEASHYYAARQTDASPVRVNDQLEKFLFYRGVAGFDVPLSAVPLATGAIQIKNLGADAIPTIMLFQRYGGKMGFRMASDIRGEVTLAPAPLSADFAAVRAEMQRTLIAQGLYPKEASAMIETWRDSWFEEGTRVFYVVPSAVVTKILPLAVEPAPVQIARVFVGRMEVITEQTIAAADKAIERKDEALLEQFGRFLGPIADRIVVRRATAFDRDQVNQTTAAAFRSYVAKASSCR